MEKNLSSENQKKLLSFMNSNSFSNRSDVAYSDYWKTHASRMKVKFTADGVDVSGDSGFYLPESVFRKLLRRSLIAIKTPSRVISKLYSLVQQYFGTPRFMSWSQGFDATMRHDPVTDPDLSSFRINHLELRRNFSEVLKSAREVEIDFAKWTKFSLTSHVLVAYYFRNILIPYIDKGKKDLKFCEIGAGSGNLASILYREFSPRIFFIVDLPESIVNAFVHLSGLFPQATFVLPHELENEIGLLDINDMNNDIAGCFVFLTPWQINLLPDNIIDLSINTHSFQEMTHAQIDEYFLLVERISKIGGHFFCVNRVEKIPCKGNAYVEIQHEPPNRFYEYPWRDKNVRLIDEVSRLHRVCAADDTAIRLERIGRVL